MVDNYHSEQPQSDASTVVKAGDELSFLGNARHLQTSSSSFKYTPSDTIGVAKVVATRTGILEATQSESTKKKSSKVKSAKTQIDIVPLHATRYLPQVDDIVIGTVVQRNPEFFTVDINAAGYATLNSLEFQGSTRRDKPKYDEGTLVYCRVLQADKLAKTQLSCISPLDKKAWNSGEAFFGELKGGFVKDFPIRFCREMLDAEGT